MSHYQEYRRDLIARFWAYAQNAFDSQDFDRDDASIERPPVFIKDASLNNVLVNERAPAELRQRVLDEVPRRQQHLLFRSMSSSQALTQSVFGNLKVQGKLGQLADLRGDDGQPLFIPKPGQSIGVSLEHDVGHLHEPRPTSVDVFIENAGHKIAVECKLSEQEVGSCSRPRLTTKDTNYERDYCDGRYAIQRGRRARCSLTEIGVSYWSHLPQLFNWKADVDHEECPLRLTYQLVRNVLAACTTENDLASGQDNRAVLLYDERNPAFQPGGKGMVAWEQVKAALRNPALLQKCTWQQITEALRQDNELDWLVHVLNQKYGFSAVNKSGPPSL